MAPVAQPLHLEDFAWSGDGAEHEDICLCVRSIGAAFRIFLARENLSQHPHVYSQFLDSLAIMRAAADGIAHKGSGEAQRLFKLFEPSMIRLLPEANDSQRLLYDYLYPRWFIFDVRADPSGTCMQPQIRQKLWRDHTLEPGEWILWLERDTTADFLDQFRSYSSRQVHILSPATSQIDPCLVGPTKVLVDQTTCYYKGWWKRGSSSVGASPRELQAYEKMAKAIARGEIPNDMRISRLHGVVIDHDDDLPDHFPRWEDGLDDLEKYKRSIVGILLVYIENKGTLQQLAPWSDCTVERRARWAEELEGLIHTLHRAGLVWGDAKPTNVLVDTDDRLWLVGFGGGFTKGWKDEDKRDTQEGDLQGLERIKKWLAEWSQNPVDG